MLNQRSSSFWILRINSAGVTLRLYRVVCYVTTGFVCLVGKMLFTGLSLCKRPHTGNLQSSEWKYRVNWSAIKNASPFASRANRHRNPSIEWTPRCAPSRKRCLLVIPNRRARKHILVERVLQDTNECCGRFLP